MKKIYLSILTLLVLCLTSYGQAPSLSSARHGQPSTVTQTNSKNINSTYAVFPNYGWSNKTALPAGRWATGPVFSKQCISATDTGYIYLIAGYDASFANTTANTVYNTVTGTFSSKAAIPAVRGQVTPLRVGKKIYVIGGYGATSFSPVNTNSIYDVTTNTWSTGAVMPTAVGDYAAAVYKDSLIYFVGGYNGSADVNTVQIYNTFTNTWTTGTIKSGTAVAGCRMGITGNKIVFVGGYSQTLATELSDAWLGTINTSAPATIAWTALPSYPGGTVGRHAGGVTFQNTNRVYFGGGDPTGAGTSVINSVYAYNTVTNAWDSGPAMPVGVSNIVSLSGVIHKDSLYLVTMGGYNGTIVTTTHSWLNIGPASPTPTVQPGVAMCIGNTTTLTASNGLTYSWTPATALSSTSIATPVSSATATTTYTVSMSKGYGCPVNANVTVSVNPLPVVTASATNSVICFGNSTTLNGGGATSYTWTGGVIDNTAFSPTTTASYTVTGSDANGCMNTAVQSVTVNPLPIVTASATNSVICIGNSTTLNGGGATSYTWTGGVIDNTVFSPTTTASYTVTGSDANGCMNTAVQSVTVNPLPIVTASATNSVICLGNNTTLNGGGATSYTWTGGVIDNTAFSPTTTASYTVTGSDVNGCMNTAVQSVTVNSLPIVTASITNSVICFGDSTTLNGGGATSYTWTGGAIDNTAFSPTTTASYTVTGSDANGCMNTAVQSVTVNSLPVVTASATNSVICSGNSTTLNGGGATSYTWTGGVIDNTAFSPTTTASYTVTGSDANGCMNTAVQSVTVNSLPVIVPSSSSTLLCVGQTASLSVTGTASYTWNPGSLTGSSVAVSPTVTTIYTVTAIDSNGCSDSTTISQAVSACTGINQLVSAGMQINVYPNPFNSKLTIVSNGTKQSITIVNTLGEIVYSGVIDEEKSEIDLSNQASGIYFVRVGSVTKKIVKE